MIGTQVNLLLATSTHFAISWQWVTELFSDQQRMVQIGAVIAVIAIYFLTRTGANK